MADIVSIANRALLSIGARSQVSSLSEGSVESNAISVLFTPTYESLARSANWNCFRQQATLTLLAAASGTPENPEGTTLPLPPTPWLYSYALPSDCLRMRFIVPSLPAPVGGVPPTTASIGAPVFIPSQGQIPFAVAYATNTTGSPITVILTNQSQAQAVYTVNQPNPAIWDSQFQSAMVASLAAYLVPALSLNIKLMQIQVQLANDMITKARVSDGDEGVTCMDHTPDWILARGINAVGPTYNNWQYDQMLWPGGAF